MVREIGVAVTPDLATYLKSRGNVAKVKVKINLLKPRLDQIWDVLKIQCRNKIRDERIKVQREEQKKKKEVPNKVDEDFQTVNRRNGSKMKSGPTTKHQNKEDHQSTILYNSTKENKETTKHQQAKECNQGVETQEARPTQKGGRNIGISIIEPKDNQHFSTIKEVPGKGKGKLEDDGNNNTCSVTKEGQIEGNGDHTTNYTEANNKQKKRNSKKKKKKNETEEESWIQEEGNNQPIITNQEKKESVDNMDISMQGENGQTMQQGAHPNVSYPQRDINQANLNMQTSETTIGVYHGEVQNNYLKLISGTSLEEEQNLSYEEDEGLGEVDYSDEISSEASDEYASMDSDGKVSEESTDPVEESNGATTDAQANILVDTFCSQSLVDINVTSELANAIRGRGRGRGRGNSIGGRQATRGRGGKHLKQQFVGSSQANHFSNVSND
ncbi:uncharacterized protein [Nicotiana tomentosiformis]|uniref:uncharacterized protein n=1 Tax=Nicotiana tomentosiformis TaxID=4098 RepID=UPI00388C3F18